MEAGLPSLPRIALSLAECRLPRKVERNTRWPSQLPPTRVLLQEDMALVRLAWTLLATLAWWVRSATARKSPKELSCRNHIGGLSLRPSIPARDLSLDGSLLRQAIRMPISRAR